MNLIGNRIKYFNKIVLNLPLLYGAAGAILGSVFVQNKLLTIILSGILATVLIGVSRKVFMVFILCLIATVIRTDSLYGSNKVERVESNFGRNISRIQIVDLPTHNTRSTRVTAVNKGIEGKILIDCPLDLTLKCGDIIEEELSLESIPDIEEFDYAQYLSTQGIWYTSKSRSCNVVGKSTSFDAELCNAKIGTIRLLNKSLPESHTMLVAGLLWGQRANLSQEFEENLSRTGTTHIIAVSGFNVSVIILMLLKLAGIIPRKVVVVLIAAILCVFLLLVGLGNLPAMRAGIMGAALLFSKSLGRKVNIVNLLLLTVIILIFINPYSIFSVSFQLSISAFIGVVGLTDKLELYLKKFPKFCRSDFASTLSAIISTSPLTVFNFSVFSLVAPIVNLLVLPLIPVMMLLGLIQIIFSTLGFERIFSLILMPVYSYAVWVINTGGSFPFSSISVQLDQQFIVVIYYLALSLILFESSYRGFNRSRENTTIKHRSLAC